MEVRPKHLSIIFTTDEHGALRTAPAAQKAIEGMRQESPGQSLVISGGDVFQGAPESEMDHGKPALDLIPKAGYDVVALGNHDFDYGQTFLKEWTEHATYPILSANVRDSQGQLLPGVQASIIKEMDGFKVGLIGVTTQTTPECSFKENVEGLSFQDPVPVVQAEINKLREQGAQVIGLISHTEEQEEERIASKVTGIDFILAGHTHQVYEQPKMASGVPVYRSGSSREAVGKLTIQLDPATMRPMQQEWQIIRCNQDRHEGPVQELVDEQVGRYKEEMGVPVGFINTGIDGNHFASGDEMDRVMAQEIARQAGTHIGFHNQKTVRGSLEAGTVTKGDLKRVFPFPNRIQRIEVSREELLQAVQLSELRDDHTSLFFHGLKIERGSDGRACALRDEVNGQPLPSSFSVGTTDFIAGGGLDYFKSGKPGAKFNLMSDALSQALVQQQWHRCDITTVFGFRDATDYAL